MKKSSITISALLKKEIKQRSDELLRSSALQSLANINKISAQAALLDFSSELPVYTGQPPKPLLYQQPLSTSSSNVYTTRTIFPCLNQGFTGSPPSIPLLSHDGNIKDAAFTS